MQLIGEADEKLEKLRLNEKARNVLRGVIEAVAHVPADFKA